MIAVDNVKNIIIEWAKGLPCKVKVHLFGSYLKNDKIPSDIDISLEFLEPFSESQQTLLWIDNHKNWEMYLSKKFGMTADLQLAKMETIFPNI